MYVPRQTAQSDCYDDNAVWDATCWERLGIPDYLVGAAGWAWNYPKCDMTTQSGVAGERCCLPDEPWSECFLRYGWGSGANGANCSVINEQTCTWPNNAKVSGTSQNLSLNFSHEVVLIIQAANTRLQSTEVPLVKYTMWTIYMVNNFFNTYYLGKRYLLSRYFLFQFPWLAEYL